MRTVLLSFLHFCVFSIATVSAQHTGSILDEHRVNQVETNNYTAIGDHLFHASRGRAVMDPADFWDSLVFEQKIYRGGLIFPLHVYDDDREQTWPAVEDDEKIELHIFCEYTIEAPLQPYYNTLSVLYYLDAALNPVYLAIRPGGFTLQNNGGVGG
jgi:hypothetical protein